MTAGVLRPDPVTSRATLLVRERIGLKSDAPPPGDGEADWRLISASVARISSRSGGPLDKMASLPLGAAREAQQGRARSLSDHVLAGVTGRRRESGSAGEKERESKKRHSNNLHCLTSSGRPRKERPFPAFVAQLFLHLSLSLWPPTLAESLLCSSSDPGPPLPASSGLFQRPVRAKELRRARGEGEFAGTRQRSILRRAAKPRVLKLNRRFLAGSGSGKEKTLERESLAARQRGGEKNLFQGHGDAERK